jgi:hypothetical protein
MYSITILSAVFFVLFATTNALQCPPVLCRMMCPFGFEVDAEGCPFCSCRETPNDCLEPIFNYNCGGFDPQECPSSHECQFDFSGITGQCCLKSSDSTTARNALDTSTASPAESTSAASTSARSAFRRSATLTAGSTTQARRSRSPASTTQRSVIGKRQATSGTSTASPAESTSAASTTSHGSFKRSATLTAGSTTQARRSR